MYPNNIWIENKYIVGGRKNEIIFLRFTNKPFKLELSCKTNMFYPISQLFKSKRRGL